MTTSLFTPVERRIYRWSAALLVLTGFAQMPIFKRYYVADIPGLGWLARYYTTHALHYAGAAAFLFVLGYAGGRFFRDPERNSVTGMGMAWMASILGIAGTGILRTVKNLPGVALPWPLVMTMDTAHLGFVLGLGVLALAAVILRKPYLKT